MSRQIWWSCALVMVLANSAWTQDAAKEKPYLVVDAGGHTGFVRQVLFSHDGKELITVSYDKTIRIWDAATGQPLRTLRPPIGRGRYGILWAAALHPQGKLLAVAGLGEPSGERPIYVVNLSDGRLKKVLRGHKNGINCLAFTAQGNRLASGSFDHTARVWDLESGACLHVLQGHTNSIHALAFAPDGDRLATASYDHTGRIWDLVTGKSQHVLKGHKSAVRAVAWSKNGKRIATGGNDQAIRLWEVDGTLAHTFDQLKGNIVSLRFLAKDRELLFTTEILDVAGGIMRAACLDLYGTGDIRVQVRHDNTISSADVDPQERWAASAGGNNQEVLIWQLKDGKEVGRLVSRGKSPWVAGWSPDGSLIAWGNTNKGKSLAATAPLERTFSLEQLEFGPAPTDKFGGRRLELGGASLQLEGISTLHLTRADQKLTFEKSNNERVRSATLLSARQAVVGTESGLYLYELQDGKRIRAFIGHAGEVWSVAAAPNGRYFLSVAYDQTLRVWNTEGNAMGGIGVSVNLGKDGKFLVKSIVEKGPADGVIQPGDQIVAVEKNGAFIEPRTMAEGVNLLRGPIGTTVKLRVRAKDQPETVTHALVRQRVRGILDIVEPMVSLFFAGNEWVAWTPEGYYAASPGGENLMGWHVNNGPDQMASYYPAAQFRKSLYRPDVIKLLLRTGSVARALEVADEVRGIKTEVADVAEALPPKVRLVVPAKDLRVADPTLDVRARASSSGKKPVTGLQLLIDGRPLQGQAGLFRVKSPMLGDVEASWNIALTPGKHRLSVRAESAVSTSLSDEIEVHYVAPDPAEQSKRPNLYVLAVGISDYPGKLKLNYAAKDAQTLAKAFQDYSKAIFEKIEIKELTNQKATQREILKGITWLSKKMTQRDVGIIFVAGHGEVAANGGFYFLPADVDPEDVVATGVPGEQIKMSLAAMPGRVIFLLDACHAGAAGSTKRRAGGALTDDLIRDLAADERGIIVMCSSTGRQFSLESDEHQHGMFTQALVEGLQGKAKQVEGQVYLHHLDAYVTDRVRELSRGEQSPTTARPASIRSFPLSRPR